MFSPVASTIFTFRNIEKTENGEIGRAPVFIGQAAGVIGEISKYDNAIAVGTKNVLSVFGELSKESKALNYAGKFAKFASENVNLLIALSGGVKVLMSEDKTSTAITEAAALGTMFIVEGLVKKNYDKILNTNTVKNVMSSKYVKPVLNFLEKRKINGAAGAVIKGALFVAASISSYEAGHFIGDKAAKAVKNNIEKENDSQPQSKEETTQLNNTPNPFENTDWEKINQAA